MARIVPLHDGRLVHIAGWKPSRPDHRDQLRKLQPPGTTPPASFLDMSVKLVPALGVYDQGTVGDCTANMGLAAFRWLYWKAGVTNIPQFSRFYQYAKTRYDEGTPLTEDSGASIRDAVAALHLHGACPEALWPSTDDALGWQQAPTPECDGAAQQHETLSYHPLYTLTEIKQQIANWWPVCFGFSVPESFMSAQVAQTGVALYPGKNEQMVGGHAVLAIGYDDAKGGVLCLNSWGPDWGLAGTFYLPYGYFTDGLASDFWVMQAGTNIQAS